MCKKIHIQYCTFGFSLQFILGFFFRSKSDYPFSKLLTYLNDRKCNFLVILYVLTFWLLCRMVGEFVGHSVIKRAVKLHFHVQIGALVCYINCEMSSFNTFEKGHNFILYRYLFSICVQIVKISMIGLPVQPDFFVQIVRISMIRLLVQPDCLSTLDS